ncbi:MAG: peptide chain release factor 1 [Clostridiaceae bacterium]|nr:peptide chain release factor 1 [Clostridiaceae bacterium]
MFDKLDAMQKRYAELTAEIGKPDVIADQELWQKLVKEHSTLAETVDAYAAYLKQRAEVADLEIMRDEADGEMREFIREEITALKKAIGDAEQQLKIMLLPKDPKDDNNVVIEIRAGAGGDEAGLFGTELMKMYMRYAEINRWKTEEINMNITELGGVKEVVFMIIGRGAYSKLKYESGVHRVQRVPATESQGRIHTSTVTVAVLPEVEDVEVVINEKDLKIDTYRSGGAGGQHVNKTESAIRITHLPTGLVVTCEDERSQIKNRDKAMKVLKSRLYDHFLSQAEKEYSENRRSQVGTGDRSERIRTYNYPQGRVTDHRIGFTLYALTEFLAGDMTEMVEALQLYDQNARLSSIE